MREPTSRNWFSLRVTRLRPCSLNWMKVELAARMDSGAPWFQRAGLARGRGETTDLAAFVKSVLTSFPYSSSLSLASSISYKRIFLNVSRSLFRLHSIPYSLLTTSKELAATSPLAYLLMFGSETGASVDVGIGLTLFLLPQKCFALSLQRLTDNFAM